MTKKTNFKKHLLASASLLAIGAFAQGVYAADGANLSTDLDGNIFNDQILDQTVTLTGIHTNGDTDTASHVLIGSASDGFTLNTGAFAHTSVGGGVDGDWLRTSSATTANLTVTAGGSISNDGANASFVLDLDHSFGTITNNGTIQNITNASVAINVITGATVAGIVNSSTGTISALTSGTAINLAGTSTLTAGIANAGTIRATTTGKALNVGGAMGGTVNTTGLIYNTGLMTAAGSAGAVTIAGAITNSGTGVGLYNAGSITDTSAGVALLLSGAGATVITNASGGTISASGAGKAVSVTAALTGTFTNSAGATISTAGAGTGFEATSGGDITAFTNAGTISTVGGGKGINVASGRSITTITNSGAISDTTTGQGINFAGTSTSSIINSGSIFATTSGTGVNYVGAVTGNLTNSGSIYAVTSGVGINLGGDLAGSGAFGGIYNTGTISSVGGTGAVTLGAAITNTTTYVAASGLGSGLYNAKNITETTGIALLLSGAGATNVTNASTGSISNTTGTAAINISANATGILLNAGTISTTTGAGINVATGVALTTLKNSGVIQSTVGGASAGALTLTGTGVITTVTNSGTIADTSTGAAINVLGTTASATTITNTGVIQAANTSQTSGAIKITGDASNVIITNSAGGAIKSTAGGAAIYLTAVGSRIGAISNSGTISATSSSLNAIDVAATTAGSVGITNNATGLITGNILTGITAGVDTITLKGVNTAATTSTIGLNGNISFGLATDIVSFEQGSGNSQYYVGTITGASTTSKGILNAVSGTTYLTAAGTGAHTIASSTITNGATLYFNGATTTTSTMTGSAVVDGTLQVGSKNTLTVDTANGGVGVNATNGVVTIDVLNTSGTITHGKIAATGATSVNTLASSSGALTVNYSTTGTAYMANNTMLANVITSSHGTPASGLAWNPGTAFASIGTATAVATGLTTSTVTGTGNTLTDNSYTLAFTAYRDATTASTLDIIVTRANTFQSASTDVNGSAVGSALETVANTGDAALDTISGTLDGLSSASAVASALETLSPTNVSSGSTTAAIFQTMNVAVGTVEHRMETARNEMSGSGVATGGKMANNGVWGEVFGSSIDQATRNSVDGYQATVGGFSLGADTLINSQTRLGAAFAYANTGAEGTGNNTDVDTYQGSLYGTYDMGKVYYEGVGTFAYNDYSTTRNLFDGSIASGSFAGQQYAAKATAGYKADVQGGLKVTPFVSAEYAFLSQDSYTETGSNANLLVKTDDTNIFKTGLGTKLAYPITDGGLTYTPRMSAAWYYDLIGDEASSTANFTSATTTFITKGASVARNSFRLGTGLDVLAQDNVTVSLDYNWDAKQEFSAHTGELKARFEF